MSRKAAQMWRSKIRAKSQCELVRCDDGGCNIILWSMVSTKDADGNETLKKHKTLCIASPQSAMRYLKS